MTAGNPGGPPILPLANGIVGRPTRRPCREPMARRRSASGTHDPTPAVVGCRPYRKKWMNYLLIAPDLGFQSAAVRKGGLQAHGRSVARALASCRQISRLGVWCQVDTTTALRPIRRMVDVHAHSRLDLDVRTFGGSRIRLSSAMAAECLRRSYDRIMYLLVNQATLSWLPAHAPYAVWEIGPGAGSAVALVEMPQSARATLRLSISKKTAETASLQNPYLPPAHVVHLCTERRSTIGKPQRSLCARGPTTPRREAFGAHCRQHATWRSSQGTPAAHCCLAACCQGLPRRRTVDHQ